MEASTERRNSGIALVGDLPWGSHFCQFYQTKKDLLDVLVPYFRAGLENNEFCVWVTSGFFTTEVAMRAMNKGVPGFPEYLAKRQLEIFPYTDWYLKGGGASISRKPSVCGWKSTMRRFQGDLPACG